MIIVEAYLLPSPGFIAPPLRRISVSATRDGEETPNYKEAVLWASIYERRPLLFFALRNGVSRVATAVASAVDGGRAIMLYDFEIQPFAAVRTPAIGADVSFSIDLNDGTGGGGPSGSSATTEAVVRVDSVPASREIVAIEKTTTGEWRMAGNQLVSVDELEVRVTGGLVYAVALDDYGEPFQAGLQALVGQRVRPTQMRGWLYEITEPGTLPAIEPDWWPIDGDNASRPLGTARAIAVRYYRPLAHGPITVEMT